MNRLAAQLVEKAIAYTFFMRRLRGTPDPFRRPTQDEAAWLRQTPQTFYAVPAAAPRLDFCTDCLSSGVLHERAVRDQFTFPSADLTPFPENNTVHGLANLRQSGQARAALVIIHGHAMTDFSLLERYAQPAMQMGMDVYFIALPYHMQRAPRGTWSGQYALNANIPGSAQAFQQGVHDVRLLMNWIETERRVPIVLLGVSLGAYTSCMTAVVDDRPQAVISILGGGSLAQILWDGYQLGRSRAQLVKRGVTLAELERDWALLGPTNGQPKVARERILLLAGKYDPVVTPDNVDRLWQAWDHPQLHWYPSGHGSIIFHHRRVREDIFRFLAARL